MRIELSEFARTRMQDAVDAARHERITPLQFVTLLQEAWAESIATEQRFAKKDFTDMLKPVA
jgi:D-alanyl-D-alanine carboxypeptidase